MEQGARSSFERANGALGLPVQLRMLGDEGAEAPQIVREGRQVGIEGQLVFAESPALLASALGEARDHALDGRPLGEAFLELWFLASSQVVPNEALVFIHDEDGPAFSGAAFGDTQLSLREQDSQPAEVKSKSRPRRPSRS